MERSIYISGADLAAQVAAQRMIGEGGRGFRGPETCESWLEVPPGGVVIGSLALDSDCGGPICQDGVTSVVIVPTHADGLQAMSRGADHYIVAAEVDGPVPETIALQIRRADSARSSGFGNGVIDQENCVDGQALRWLIAYTGSVVHRHGQIGYMILLRVVPEETVPSEALAELICTRLCATMRSADIVSWLGRNWFASLVATGLTLEGAQVLAGRLREACGHPIDYAGRRIAVRCNIGMTTFGGSETDPDMILDRAAAAVDQSTWSNFNESIQEAPR
ncbi:MULTISPECIES: hypothetical protein [Thalassobaculum]|uniref:Uncharacterized protein n=1 Tax=Thalassobaculum litoreum DSM 18839 TaxID=1123362 RepID=A0A8G2BKX6_9PROT|nr:MULTISPECIES: hypothetical protein [Thalassobaculum]SDG30877.1 hypothetical protein SAMN05660686_03977 [Thalassobaculum litoreum DSM 18839]